MDQTDPNFINSLIARFMQLHEAWQSDPAGADWASLQALGREGARAYNENGGPSFHALVLDGVQHGEFHERFLAYSLDAGFDPFKVEKGASDAAWLPVIDHANLAEAATSNPSSARMHESLRRLAGERFEPLAQQVEQGAAKFELPLFWAAEACAESIPKELLMRIEPSLVAAGRQRGGRPDTEERFLSTPEAIIDSKARYG